LLPHFLPPRTALPHTLVVVVLDWTRPWTFVEELETWLQWIETWAKGDGSRELEIVREENKERCRLFFDSHLTPLFISSTGQSHLQHYTEPSTDPIPTTSTLSNTVLPLGPGTLTHNSAGVPIIVACTKADLIDEGHDLVAGASGMGGMVKGTGGEWEERTDGIMQILRTISLKCKQCSISALTIKLNPVCNRRSCAFLHYSTARNVASSKAIRLAFTLRASCTST